MNEAIPWYTKAAEQGNLDAQLRLGNYYSKADSKGTSLDMEAAIRWYTKAAELGSTEAKAKLEQCAEEQRQIEATPKAAAERIKKMTVTMSGGKTTVSFPNGSELELIKVEAGTFEMSKDGKIERGEVPHPVTLTQDFYLGRTEVTQALWKTVMGMKP